MRRDDHYADLPAVEPFRFRGGHDSGAPADDPPTPPNIHTRYRSIRNAQRSRSSWMDQIPAAATTTATMATGNST